MSEWMYANVVRGGTTTIARNIYVQFSPMGAKEAAEYQGADPSFTYNMYTKYLPVLPVELGITLQQGDHVIDTQVVDPKTEQKRSFLIISSPQPKGLMMSWQWIAIKVRGN